MTSEFKNDNEDINNLIIGDNESFGGDEKEMV
jgi:hypothetical protein